MGQPEVSIVIPCRNEASFLPRCLDSIVESDYPKGKLEVIVVDGQSDDGTLEVASRYAQRYPFIRVLRNERRTTPAALNQGVAHARGEYVIILGAHAAIDRAFVRLSVQTLADSGADCVGGVVVTLPGSDGLLARAIANVMSSAFGMGNSYFRVGATRPRWVDTVAFGCYRRSVFDRIGGFDEALVRNQDDEFNFRLRRQGGKILLNPEIVSYYYGRDSLRKLWRMFFQYGLFKPLVARRIGRVMTWRQLGPPAFVASIVGLGLLSTVLPAGSTLLLGVLGAYAAASGIASVQVGIQKRDVTSVWLMPPLFALVHLAYGLGYLLGSVRFFLLGMDPALDAPLSR